MLIDTHAHFSAEAGVGPLQELIERAAEAGVDRIVAVGGSEALNSGAFAAAKTAPDRVYITLGYDRDQASELAGSEGDTANNISRLALEIRTARADGITVVGVGETGLDFHYTPETAELQLRLLRAELALARELALPVIVHSREADEETVAALREHAAAWQGAADGIGVLHCFTGGIEFARELLDLGVCISFSGIVTFRNAAPLREVAAFVPADRLLIETDSPYLAPVPLRGKRNEPSFLPHVAEVVAAQRGIAVEELASLTTRNAQRLFNQNKLLGEILVAQRYISPEQLQEALLRQRTGCKRRLGQILLDLKYISLEDIIEVLELQKKRNE